MPPLLCTVDVFPMMVERQRDRGREQGQRTLQWFSAEEAATAVELQTLIDEFAWSGVKAAHAVRGDEGEATPTG